jgi:hypothetical protein
MTMPNNVSVLEGTLPQVPVVCDTQVFTREQRASQLALGLDVLCRLPRKREELSEGYLFEYEGNEALFSKVAQFASNEHRCCPWIGFGVEMAPFPPGQAGLIWMRMTARDAEGKDFMQSSLRMLEEHLAALGTTIDYDRAAEAIVNELGPTITPKAVEDRLASGPRSWKDLFKGCGC